MKRVFSLVMLLLVVILSIIGILGMTGKITIYGNAMTPVIFVVAINAINSLVTKSKKRNTFIRILQGVFSALSIVGVVFMFFCVPKSVNDTLFLASVVATISVFIYSLLKNSKTRCEQ